MNYVCAISAAGCISFIGFRVSERIKYKTVLLTFQALHTDVPRYRSDGLVINLSDGLVMTFQRDDLR